MCGTNASNLNLSSRLKKFSEMSHGLGDGPSSFPFALSDHMLPLRSSKISGKILLKPLILIEKIRLGYELCGNFPFFGNFLSIFY